MKRVDLAWSNAKQHAALMLTLGMFTFVVAAFLGCVWWACRDEEA